MDHGSYQGAHLAEKPFFCLADHEPVIPGKRHNCVAMTLSMLQRAKKPTVRAHVNIPT
jgi:hypothetical protein